MPLLFVIVLFGVGVAVIAMLIEAIAGRNSGVWLVIYIILGFIGAFVGAFAGFGDAPILLKYGVLSTYTLSFLGSALFVLLGILWHGKKEPEKGNKHTSKILGLYLGAALLIVMVVILLSIPSATDKIKAEIGRANYCSAKSDCYQLTGKCPFDCYIHVNKNETERIKALVEADETKCVYGCIDAPPFDCINGKCVAILDERPGRRVISSFKECEAAGFPVMESYPRQCRSEDGQTFVEEVDSIEVREDKKACTMEYSPVCGKIQIQCITTPCDPVEETFSNRCVAESREAFDIREGTCEGEQEVGRINLEEKMVEEYVRKNISDLSPEKEVLGGKFYVTNINFLGVNDAEVEYEDGHIALKASFTYNVVNEEVRISNFKNTDSE